MSDDLGRGVLGWPPERWQALDTLASDSVTASAVMRNLIDNRDAPGQFSARIAAQNVPIVPINADFVFDMENGSDEDLERGVRLAAQNLALAEDTTVVQALNLANPQQSPNLQHGEFIRAKNALRKNGVQQGYGIVVSTEALTVLETEPVGVQTGREVTEHIVGTTVTQSNALPTQPGVQAVILQAAPPAYRMVRGWGPRLRVLGIQNGNVVNLRLEESIAVGELEPNRCLGIHAPAPGRAARANQ